MVFFWKGMFFLLGGWDLLVDGIFLWGWDLLRGGMGSRDPSRDLLWISTILPVGSGWDVGGMGLGGVDEKVFLSMACVMQLVVGSWLAGLVGYYGVRCNFGEFSAISRFHT